MTDSTFKPFRRVFLLTLACLGAAIAPVAAEDGEAAPPGVTEVEDLNDAGQYAEAEELGLEVLAALEAEHGEDSLEVGLILDALVVSLLHQQRASEPRTLEMAERSLAIKRAERGDRHLDVAPWSAPVRPARTTRAGTVLAKLLPFRGETPSCSGFERLSFQELPGAKREADAVSREWRRRAARAGLPPPQRQLEGPEATEAAFKAMAPAHRYLHLATHGFFLGDDCDVAGDEARGVAGVGEAAEPARRIENPLLRSGLALAGFNRRAEAPADAEDGVLTAQEVASLDLSAVEWAVLSACETVRGDIAAQEGVLGLQRAFRIAGVDSIIMSLWSVDDRATEHWMSALYESRLGRGRDTPECVRDASLAVLRERRATGASESPFYWGAFVGSGSAR